MVRYEVSREHRTRAGARETVHTFEGGLALDWPEVAVLRVGYQVVDTSAFLREDGLSRRAGRAELRVRLWGRDDRTVSLVWERRENDYTLNERDYTEEVLAAKLTFRF